MASLTYAEVGATEAGELPPGYRHLRYRTAVGRDVFAAAAEAVLTWRMHRAAGIRVDTAAERAAPGVDVTMHVGPLPAPCRVPLVPMFAVEPAGPVDVERDRALGQGHPGLGRRSAQLEIGGHRGLEADVVADGLGQQPLLL